MSKRVVIDTGDTMVAMITDIVEQIESAASGDVRVGDRVRVCSGLYAGVVGEVKLIISGNDEDAGGYDMTSSKRDVA